MVKSSTFTLLLSLLLVSLPLFAVAAGTQDGMEEWGYVEVRPKAHMFWWLYRSPQRVPSASTPWPIVLFLVGGPGLSGTGHGNFEEIGPLDTDLKARNSTWLQKADLLFVDNPVGSGYSYVEDKSALVSNDEEIATDLTTLLEYLFNDNESLQKSPLYIVAESYGGRYGATLGVSIVKAVEAGQLKVTLGGVALGDSWISPEDYVFSWGPLLKDVSRLDSNGLAISNSYAEKIKQQLANGQYEDATNSWLALGYTIVDRTNGVSFYNILLDQYKKPVQPGAAELSRGMAMHKYSTYLSSRATSTGDLSSLMNGSIKKKLQIIPENVIWGNQSSLVFSALWVDFMKPRINEVDELLSKGVDVTIYNGQLDLLCATKGTEAWVQKLQWAGLTNFNSLDHTPLYCGGYDTKGFNKSYNNLHFYWILGAGHFVPVEQPCITLKMLAEITHSPAHAGPYK